MHQTCTTIIINLRVVFFFMARHGSAIILLTMHEKHNEKKILGEASVK